MNVSLTYHYPLHNPLSYVVKASAISSEDYDAHYQASYVIQELIKMAKLADMSDEAGRKNLIAVTKFIICEAEITVQVNEAHCMYQSLLLPWRVLQTSFSLWFKRVIGAQLVRVF